MKRAMSMRETAREGGRLPPTAKRNMKKISLYPKLTKVEQNLKRTVHYSQGDEGNDVRTKRHGSRSEASQKKLVEWSTEGRSERGYGVQQIVLHGINVEWVPHRMTLICRHGTDLAVADCRVP